MTTFPLFDWETDEDLGQGSFARDLARVLREGLAVMDDLWQWFRFGGTRTLSD